MIAKYISNHPVISGMTRQAEIMELKFDEQQKIVNMELNITHYFNEVSIKELDKKIRLIANNSVLIGEIGDYDFIISQIENDAPIKTLLYQIIDMRDTDGTINRKMGYIIPTEEEIEE
jgi:hypothetical protein